MQTIDCRGQQCPQPVIQVRRRLQAAPGTLLEVLVSDPAARDNIARLATGLGYRVSSEPREEGFRLELAPGESPATGTGTAATTGPTVVFIASDRMGSGDDQLGHILLKNFLFTLTEGEQTPDLILFVNGGAKLTVAGSEVLEALHKLADRGTDIATCGLCLDFFGLKENLAVGRVTNMLEIATALHSAGRTVRP